MPSWASDRVDMPVIDDDNVAIAAKALDGGQVNVNPPFRSGGADDEFKKSQRTTAMKKGL